MVNGKYSETKLSCEETLPRLKDVEHLEHCAEATPSSSQKPMSVEINLDEPPRLAPGGRQGTHYSMCLWRSNCT